MGKVSDSSPVKIDWSLFDQLKGESAGEDITNLLNVADLSAASISKNVTELELNMQQALANKNASGQTDINKDQYNKLETGLQKVISTANVMISESSSSSSINDYMAAMQDLITDMQGEFVKTDGNNVSSFSGGTNGYAAAGNSAMAALYPDAQLASDSSSSTAVTDPQKLTGSTSSTVTDPQKLTGSTSGTVTDPHKLTGSTSIEDPTTLKLYPSGGAPTADDVQQSTINDCFLDATLAGLAGTQAGRKVITDAISKTSTEGAEPEVFNVAMYAPNGSKVQIPVDDSLLQKNGKVANVTGKDGKADWATLMEKAYAKYVDMYPNSIIASGAKAGASGYNLLDGGGNAMSAMRAITGHAAEGAVTSDSTALQIGQSIKDKLDSGSLVVADTGSEDTYLKDGTKIDGGHAYTVSNVNLTDNTITVRNPWGVGSGGDNGVVTLSLAEFKKHFLEFDFTGKAAQSDVLVDESAA